MNDNLQFLNDLLKNVTGILHCPELKDQIPVAGVSLDSRKVNAGFIFVAITGGQRDGHDFIPAVIQQGAAAIVGTQPKSNLGTPYIQVEDSRLALAQLAAAFHGYPARQMQVIGVTGTDGKTTTCNLIYHMLKAAGLQVGLISTVNAVVGEEYIDTGFHVTTPEAPMVQNLLASMVKRNLTHVVLEATSHGLDQKRLSCCEFDIAVITNITHEHLDYHGTYENYFNSKARLVYELVNTMQKSMGNPRLCVFNQDDISYPRLLHVLQDSCLKDIKPITYSLKAQAELKAKNIVSRDEEMHFDLYQGKENWPVQTSLMGEYNAANILAAFGAAVCGAGIQPVDALKGIKDMMGVPGRMQKIEQGQKFTAIVDFAHTPNALKVSLETARQISAGKVIAIFGSAGLRDRIKRRLMAETSIHLADITILTAEDPRTELLEDILAEMKKAAQSVGGVEGRNFFVVPDRGEAIRLGVDNAEDGDLVIACGKGHEQSMCFGEVEYAWDDRIAMQAALAERLGKPGPKMPYLPTQVAN